MSTPVSRLPALGAGLMAAAMTLPLVDIAQAESAPERGLVAFKALDYQDSQPGIDRIHVKAPSLQLLYPLSGAWAVGGTLTADHISGASPYYYSSGLGQMQDERHAAEAEATRYWEHGSLKIGANWSKEHDYLSRGVSVQATRSTEDKNTTFTAGLGYSSDRIDPSNQIVVGEHKRVVDVLVGVTQVMSTHDIAQLNLGFSQGRGYFSDPYKAIDKRPRSRDHTTVLARWNHHFDATEGTLRSSWRYYRDTYGVRSHTLGLEYVQPLSRGWTVTPLLRLYTQSAANFYIESPPGFEPGPFGPPVPEGAVYTSFDHRLSGFGARTLGLKVAKQVGNDWLFDVKVENYEQRGSWRAFGGGSRGLEPFYARSIQVGAARQF